MWRKCKGGVLLVRLASEGRLSLRTEEKKLRHFLALPGETVKRKKVFLFVA